MEIQIYSARVSQTRSSAREAVLQGTRIFYSFSSRRWDPYGGGQLQVTVNDTWGRRSGGGAGIGVINRRLPRQPFPPPHQNQKPETTVRGGDNGDGSRPRHSLPHPPLPRPAESLRNRSLVRSEPKLINHH